VKALIADDDRGTLAILEKTVREAGLDVVSARDGAAAWQLLQDNQGVSVAILDWMMPGLDGPELCRRVRATGDMASMYVILLTGRDGVADLVAGLEAGADDYIVKPFDFGELHARVRVGMRVATLQDRLAAQVAELRDARDTLARLASTDVLTELYSRRRWYEVGGDELRRYQRYGRPFSVLVADLDFFKQVNDTHGHATGDDVLKHFAGVLKEESRKADVFGRVGGEEFAALLPETGASAALDAATRIAERCRERPIVSPTGAITVTCSIGVAEVEKDDASIDTVVKRADDAMYQAKRQGRNRAVVWTAPPAASL